MSTVPSAGQFGFIPDSLPQELPPNAWSFAQNIRYRDGYAEKFGGSSQVLTTPTVTPYWITPYRNLASKFWVYTGLAKVFVDDGATRTDITPTVAPTGAVDDRWTGGSASGVLVMNNGKDVPIFWGGNVGTLAAPLTAWTSTWRAVSLRPFKQYIVACGITKGATVYANMVKWSVAAVPGSLPTSWNEADPTKDAGEVDLAETTDVIVDQLPLGDVNIIYKEKSMYSMQYIGPPFIWKFARLPGETGMLTRGCAASTPKGHVVLTAGDLILHSGLGPTSIAEGRVRKWLFNSIDPTNFAKCFLCTNDALSEVWVCFPETGATTCTKALVWNWADDTFSVRQLQNATYGASGQVIVLGTTSTWATDPGTWNTDTTTWNSDGFAATQTRLLLTQTDPLIALMETGGNFIAATPTSILERTGMAFDEPGTVKTVRSVVPRFDAVAGTQLTIQVGAAMDAEQGTVWGNVVSYTVGTTRKADCFASGRFLAIRVTGATTASWRLKSYDMDVIEHGAY